ncbi:MAG TPA: hypothetical protein VNL77_05520, partial [Roseiflexaceae bacterium]|nr:hypothetical protein [Roseiflexaceae bacterium]
GPGSLMWAAGALAQHWWRALALLGLYTLPGLALLRLLWPRAAPLAPAARLALAPAVSAALPPLLLLLAETLGLRWGAWTTWGYLLASLAIYCRLQIADRRSAHLQPNLAPHTAHRTTHNSALPTGLLLGLTLAALLARFYVVRDLPAGLLGDSYQHTLMAQLLVDNGGLFRSWEPYAPLTTFTYHFGFHANAAFVHWLTGVGVVTGVIWTGQLLNALAVPAAFALVTVALRGSAWAGLWAALITGFVLTIPAYYVVWGRYTQLAGQLVLVAAVACWARLAECRVQSAECRVLVAQPNLQPLFNLQSEWRLILLTGILTAAMLLTHYLVTVFAALFAASYVLALLLARASWRDVGRVALAATAAGLVALLLAAPWLLNLASGYLVRNAVAFSSGAVDPARVAAYTALPHVTPLYAKSYVLLAALAGLLVALWRRDWRAALPAVWAALLILAVVPQAVGLPGAGTIDHLTGMSALYLALAPLAGYALAAAQALVWRPIADSRLKIEDYELDRSEHNAQASIFNLRSSIGVALASLRWLGLAAALFGVVAWGASWQARQIDGSTQLVSHADMAAMAWVRAHTPPTARFMVNGFPAYGGTLVAGSDAGWWIPLLAGRQTTLPPLTYGSERGPTRDYGWNVGLFYQDLRGRRLTDSRPVPVDLTTPEALALLRAAKITHVYIGAAVSPGPAAADWIDTAKLRASPAFRLVYERDGVEIYELVRE